MNLSNFSSGLWLKIFLGSKIKLFSFLSDPISFNHYYIKNSMLKHRFAKYFEKIGFKMCDFIVVPSQLMQTKYIELYPIYKYKFKTIPHSYKRVNQSLNFKSNKPKEVTHLGTLSSLRTPIPIIKAILKNEQFFKEKQIHFKFIGHIDKEIKESLNKNNYISEIISFVGKIPITEIESHITSASILLVIDANLPFSPYLPSKLVDMMPYNKPILGITPINSESARVLSLTNNAFITYENLSQFGFVIKNVLETDYIPKNLSQFHIDNIGYQWDLILNS